MCDQWEKDFLNGKCALGKGVGKADWAALVAPAFFFLPAYFLHGLFVACVLQIL